MIDNKIMKIKTAPSFIAWFLRKQGYQGITLPPFGVFVLAGDEANKSLISHERVHWDQYLRLGALRFYATYLYYQVRYGYEKNPMEIEARTKANSYTS
jgi:hypothetical protein